MALPDTLERTAEVHCSSTLALYILFETMPVISQFNCVLTPRSDCSHPVGCSVQVDSSDAIIETLK